jgi:hypothetical protein
LFDDLAGLIYTSALPMYLLKLSHLLKSDVVFPALIWILDVGVDVSSPEKATEVFAHTSA